LDVEQSVKQATVRLVLVKQLQVLQPAPAGQFAFTMEASDGQVRQVPPKQIRPAAQQVTLVPPGAPPQTSRVGQQAPLTQLLPAGQQAPTEWGGSVAGSRKVFRSLSS
jgi:hypothetical protein